MNTGAVIAVCADQQHNMMKPERQQITLVAGYGVQGDAHFGKTIQHLYDKRRNPDAPNLRQVHLIHAELIDTLARDGLEVDPGQMGENITTRGINLLDLPRGTRLHIGGAVIEITGLRNPCGKLNTIQKGLLPAVLAKDDTGAARPKTGVMAIVVKGGDIRPGAGIKAVLPDGPPIPLTPV